MSDDELGPFQRGFYRRDELEVHGALPTDDVVKEKRVAVIECIESIPCDPCGFICPVDAIRKDSLVAPPVMDWGRCVGCTKCVPICPMPYEQVPEPRIGDLVELFDRSGREVGEGKIVNPTYQARGDPNPLWCVTVEFTDSKLVYDVRAFRIKK
jgi:ferredoxin